MGNKTIKKIFFAIIIILAGFLFFNTVYFRAMPQKENNDLQKIKISESIVFVEIADLSFSQIKGLSGREYLKKDNGMLFVFNDSRQRSFWMKDMNFPLDVIWISDFVVVEFLENIKEKDEYGETTRFSSNVPVNMVLEINSGWIKENKIKIGDKVVFLE
jgi:uncharacterized protein